jgi:hypothetical protein
MADTSAEALTELERQAEARRAGLVQTVDELHNRVSPQAIKADVRNYARERMLMVEERLRDNPLQAAAIAIGIAYPLWRIIGRIPAPVLLIGAGVALSRRGRNEGHRMRRPNGDEFDDNTEGYGSSTTGSGMTKKLSDAGSAIAEKASDTIEDVRGMASEKMANIAGTLSGGYRSSREAAAGAASQIEDTYIRTRDGAVDLFDRHPMLAGGVAFAVGGLVASSLPVTPQENRILGETSDDIKRRTQDLASEGLGEAKVAAQRIYDETATQVGEQGLSPDVAANTVRDAVDTAREAVERKTGAADSAQPRAGSKLDLNPGERR